MSPSARIRKSVHSPEQRVLRDLLIEARKKSGLTQKNLAGRLDRHQSFVAKYERGERRLDMIEFIGVVRAIGADPVGILRALIWRGV